MQFKTTTPFLTCKDHTLSGETFQLLRVPDYEMLLTSPQPSASELPKYYQSEAYISHTDSRKTLLDKVYQAVKSFMLRKKLGLVEKYHPQKGSLLDIGAGTGDFLNQAKRNSWNIFGTEPNEKARKIAEEKKVNLQTGTKNFPDEHFDAISMWHVLEHVPDLETQLKELQRLLKSGGTLFIAVPNFKSYDAQHYREFWAAYDVPRHLWHFSQKSFVNLFATFGFELQESVPLKFDAYYVSLLSEKYKSGKSGFFKAVWIGFLSNWKARATKQYSSHIYVLKRREYYK